MFDSLMGNRRPLAKNGSLVQKQSKSDLRKEVGKRFVSAREMNGLSQTEAAERFGYKNSAQLCQWEQGKRLPPIDRMIVASVVYQVSLDYLYGLSDEPERDPRQAEQHAMVRTMQDMLRANAEAVANALVVHAKTGGANMMMVRAVHAKASEAALAMRKFIELNVTKFEAMRGSAHALAACEALETLVREVQTLITRADGLKENVIRTAEVRARTHHPLFETPEYRQGQLAGV